MAYPPRHSDEPVELRGDDPVDAQPPPPYSPVVEDELTREAGSLQGVCHESGFPECSRTNLAQLFQPTVA